MPFVRIDFSSYDSSAALQKRVNVLFEEIQKYPRLVSNLLAFRCDYALPKKPFLRSLATLHSGFIGLLSVLLLISLFAHVYFLQNFEGVPLTIEICHVLIYVQGFASFVFLIWWQKSQSELQVHQSLVSTTSGVGFVKHNAGIYKINSSSFVFGCLAAFLLVFRLGFSLFSDAFSYRESPLLDYSFLPIQFRLCLLLSAVFFVFAIPAANSVIFSHIGIVIAEFHSLDCDFSEDINTYQLAVTKHYISLHWKISQLWFFLSRPITILFSLQISVHVVSVLLLATSRFHLTEWPYEIAIGFALSLHSVIVLTFVFALALVFRNRATALQLAQTALVANERALHDLTYSAVCVYNGFLQHCSLGISFFELRVIDKPFVFNVIFVSIVAITLHLMYNREVFL
ncbi:hypothetical protein L596_019050 [Steinernema carpocapsae]|uniref:Gustatory receptor n=1 Tax=Steinernema carpocapsae TaxID=34508 RepID=A0A4U5N7B9_STECR|nr:hypothetical protein L596_019050 [Steinernema carpocapsae]